MFNLQLIKSVPSVKKIFGTLANKQVNLVSDSRKVKDGDVFLAICGEKIDAAKFIPQVLNNQVAAVVFRNSEQNLSSVEQWQQIQNTVFISVDDEQIFLKELATLRMSEWKQGGGKVIGITGSNGKTTHRQMLTHLIGGVYGDNFAHTEGNLNNYLGVPFTVLSILDTDRYAVIEMGSNHPGEIEYLCSITQPDMGIITNVGDSHLEFFKDREGVFKEKSTLFYAIENSTNEKLFCFNGNDQYLTRLPKKDWSFEIHPEATATCLNIFGQEIKNPNLLGVHNYSNLAVCMELVHRVFGHEEQLVELAKTFAPKSNRSEIKKINGKQYYMDAYNANPSSMEASLRAMKEGAIFDFDKTLFVLGDMNELGDNSEKMHHQIGCLCAELGIKNAIFVGRFATSYAEGFDDKCELFNSVNDLKPKFVTMQNHYENFFIKGSRSLQLESLIDIT